MQVRIVLALLGALVLALSDGVMASVRSTQKDIPLDVCK